MVIIYCGIIIGATRRKIYLSALEAKGKKEYKCTKCEATGDQYSNHTISCYVIDGSGLKKPSSRLCGFFGIAKEVDLPTAPNNGNLASANQEQTMKALIVRIVQELGYDLSKPPHLVISEASEYLGLSDQCNGCSNIKEKALLILRALEQQ